MDRIMAQFAPNVRSYEFARPLQIIGAGAVREISEQGSAAFPGIFEFETQDLHIIAGDDVAFCHSLDHVRGTTQDGRDGRRLDTHKDLFPKD